MKLLKYLLLVIVLFCGCERWYETPNHQYSVTGTEGLWKSKDGQISLLDTIVLAYESGTEVRKRCFIFRNEQGVVTDSLVQSVLMDMSYNHKSKMIKMKNGDIYSFQRLDNEVRIGERLVITGPAKHKDRLKGAPVIHLLRVQMREYN